MRIIFRRLIARYFGWFVKLFYWFKFRFQKFDKSPVIILTPGKVGSSSVYYTLKNEINHPVFHIHRFSKKGTNKSIKEHLQSDRKSKPLHLIISELLKKKLDNYDGHVYIITIIREPIARAISAFFQNTEFHKNEIERGTLKIDKQKANELLTKKLNYGIIEELETWFDEEIKGNFGIDVFADSFDISKEYSIKRSENEHFLLLKMESLDDVFPYAIKEFLDLPTEVQLKRVNIGAEKHYSETYKEIKQNITLCEQELDKIINSKFFQKFYQTQTDAVNQKWGDN